MTKTSIMFTTGWACVSTLLLAGRNAAAQGEPTNMGSHIPIALWVIGTLFLALALAYGIHKNRQRSRRDKQLTDAATRANYADEE